MARVASLVFLVAVTGRTSGAVAGECTRSRVQCRLVVRTLSSHRFDDNLKYLISRIQLIQHKLLFSAIFRLAAFGYTQFKENDRISVFLPLSNSSFLISV